MTQQFAAPEPELAATQEPFYVRMGDAFVIVSATLMSLAAGAWLIARLELDLSYAILVALGAYCALLLLHLLMRRAVLDDGRPEEEVEDEDDIHWQTGAEAFDTALSHDDDQAEGAPSDEEAEPRSRPDPWSSALPMPERDAPEASQPFNFRPARLPYFEPAPASDRPTAKEQAVGANAAGIGALSGELNVEVIQDLIKKLADELNGPAPREGDAPGRSGSGAEPGSNPEAMIDRSAAALETAARAMRSGHAEQRASMALPSPGSDTLGSRLAAAQDGVPAGGPPLPNSELARIAEAVAAERFEVLIEPIHVLAEGRPRHYEVTMRLRTADGEPLEQADYTRAAQDSELLPHIDAARMLRAARVARRLAERGRQGSVLSALGGDSITDNAFRDALGQQTPNDGRVRLVLSFAQGDARNFTPAHAEALGTMAAAGFGFALEDVTDLDMDFGRLKALGFEFVKLDAQVFLDGMQAPGGCIPAADICRYLSEFGLSLIVGAIEDDWLLAKIMGFGVLLGKGTLFGGPRLIKSMEPGAAAA
jgi:cyclic-di-GMP phosphodiesterase TipF (flagellum assembly factor)